MEHLRFPLQPGSKSDIHFLAPMSLEECVERLERRHGTFFSTKTAVSIEQVDADQYTLQMRVNRADKNAFDITVYGTLQRQDSATTEVIISSRYTQHPPSAGVLIVMMIILGFVLLLALQNIVVLVFPLLAGFVYIVTGRDNFKEIVLMIEETLGARTPSDKTKNSEAA